MALRRSRQLRRLISTERPGLSVTTKQSVVEQVRELWPMFMAHRARMMEIDAWTHGDLEDAYLPVMPSDATDEFRKIRRTSPTPWGQLIVQSLSQTMIVDDIKLASGMSAPAYDLWQRNGLDAKQVPLIEAAVTFGMAYNKVLPAVGRLDNKRTAMIRGKSPLNSLAFYRDDFDEYPEFFIEAYEQANDDLSSVWVVTFTDEDAEHRLSVETLGGGDLAPGEVTYIEPLDHPMQICPVVRIPNRIDLLGRTTGEIAPFTGLFGRINQDTQDRLVVQRYGAWAVRTIAGMKKPGSEAEQRAARLALGVGDLLVAEEPTTKFGSLAPTPMDGYIRSRESDIRDLAAVSQTPAHNFLGLTDNVGAEGLAAAEASFIRKRDQRKLYAGQGHENSLRLGGFAAGIEEVATDYTSRVHWVATESQSFEGLVQSLGIMVATMGMPLEMVVERLPDWTQLDTDRLVRLVRAAEAKAQAEADLEADRQAQVAEKTAAAKAVSGGNGTGSGAGA